MELKKLLRLRNLTMEEVAKKVGVTKMTISHYANGKRQPTPSMLNKLASVLSVDIDTLVNGKSIEKIKDDDALKELLSLCNSLNKKGKDEVISFIGDLDRRYFK